MIDFLLYLGSGKLLLFLLKKFPPAKKFMSNGELLPQLYNCDLCFGFWVYLFVSFFMDIKVDQVKNPIVRRLIVSAISTLLAQCSSVGYSELFTTIRVFDNKAS
jgi:hypothetical protein